jgi:hypothetical protein
MRTVSTPDQVRGRLSLENALAHLFLFGLADGGYDPEIHSR